MNLRQKMLRKVQREANSTFTLLLHNPNPVQGFFMECWYSILMIAEYLLERKKDS